VKSRQTTESIYFQGVKYSVKDQYLLLVGTEQCVSMYVNSVKVKQGYYVKHKYHNHVVATQVECELEPDLYTYSQNCLQSVTALQHTNAHKIEASSVPNYKHASLPSQRV